MRSGDRFVKSDLSSRQELVCQYKGIHSIYRYEVVRLMSERFFQTANYMEFATLLTVFLSPFLPHLLKLGQPVAEEAGKKLGEKLGESSWATAKEIWRKLSPKVEEKPIAKGAVVALKEDSQDDEAKTILTSQLEKVLIANPDLAQSLQTLLDAKSKTVGNVVNVTQAVTGKKNIVIGESSGSVSINQS